MPLSSPAKGNRAESNARMQAQIVDLTKQRDELITQYLAALGTCPSGVGVAAGEEMHDEHTEDTKITQYDVPAPATIVKIKTSPSGDEAEPMMIQSMGPALSQGDVDVALNHANATLKRHIKLLHSYNEIKDIGTGIIGIIADQRGVRIVDVMEEMGVCDGD